MPAVRNIRLCTKDCLCLFVCPTGATDTEDGQIDAAKCLEGCTACVDACPSHAISLAPTSYPPQQSKTDDVISALNALAESKVKQEQLAAGTAASTNDAILRQLAEALARSNRIVAEDFVRETGYMLPQSSNAKALLQSLLESDDADLPKDAIKGLLEKL